MTNNGTRKTLSVTMGDDRVDVMINGTTQDIIFCICSTVKCLATKFMQSPAYQKLYGDEDLDDVDEEDIIRGISAQIMSVVIDSFDCIGGATPTQPESDMDEISSSLNFNGLDSFLKQNKES